MGEEELAYSEFKRLLRANKIAEVRIREDLIKGRFRDEQGKSRAFKTIPLNDPNLVNYVQQYNEDVLGEYPTNWGNIILILMIIILVLGGGYIVLKREGLVNITFGDPKNIPTQEKYPTDVMELVPEIAKLSKADRKVLHQVLSTPATTKEMLAMMGKFIKKNDSSSKQEK